MNLQDKDGHNSLHFAAQKGNVELVKIMKAEYEKEAQTAKDLLPEGDRITAYEGRICEMPRRCELSRCQTQQYCSPLIATQIPNPGTKSLDWNGTLVSHDPTFLFGHLWISSCSCYLKHLFPRLRCSA